VTAETQKQRSRDDGVPTGFDTLGLFPRLAKRELWRVYAARKFVNKSLLYGSNLKSVYFSYAASAEAAICFSTAFASCFQPA
jgi:hypothetical protein